MLEPVSCLQSWVACGHSTAMSRERVTCKIDDGLHPFVGPWIPCVHPDDQLLSPGAAAGESEANVRKLFEDAEADQKANGDASELHVIIFDEIDAICKQRGSVSSGSGGRYTRFHCSSDSLLSMRNA